MANAVAGSDDQLHADHQLSLTVDIKDMFFARVIYTIERGFKDLGYNVLLSHTGEPGRKKSLQVMLEPSRWTV